MTRKDNLSFVWIEIENVHLVGFVLTLSVAVTSYKPGGRGGWVGGVQFTSYNAFGSKSNQSYTSYTPADRTARARATHEADIHT